jgi:hypothetical protein
MVTFAQEVWAYRMTTEHAQQQHFSLPLTHSHLHQQNSSSESLPSSTPSLQESSSSSIQSHVPLPVSSSPAIASSLSFISSQPLSNVAQLSSDDISVFNLSRDRSSSSQARLG